MCSARRGKVILGYTETELCRRGSGYQFVHAADMMHCAEKHVRSECQGEQHRVLAVSCAFCLGSMGARGCSAWCSTHHVPDRLHAASVSSLPQ